MLRPQTEGNDKDHATQNQKKELISASANRTNIGKEVKQNSSTHSICRITPQLVIVSQMKDGNGMNSENILSYCTVHMMT